MKQKRELQERKPKSPQEKRSSIGKDEYGYPIYKCSLCEEMITTNFMSPVSLSSLFSLMSDTRLINIGTLQRFIIHQCENGSYGVANIAGIASRKVFLDSKKMPSELAEKEPVGPN